MPSDILVLTFIFGAILLLIALLGGGFKFYGVEITRIVKNRKLRVISGVIGIALIVFSIFFIAEEKLTKPPSLKSEPKPATSSRPSIESSPQKSLLNERQIRGAITKALHNNNVSIAIELLKSIKRDSIKHEECEHVYSYCIKNGKLDEAEIVANLCWDGQQRDEFLREIENERLKQR